MAGSDRRAPCVIGVAQLVSRRDEGPAPEPLAMWERVVREAAGPALGAVDSLDVVYCMSWPYDDPPGRLAERLGIDPRRRRYSGIGGTTPQVLVNEAAEAILAGELDVAVVVGAEALDTVRGARKADRPAWSHRDPEPKPFPYEGPIHPAEVAHEVFHAYLTFALWDVARRAHRGVEPEAYRHAMGELFAPMTTVAAANPYAWFPIERSADELVTPTPANRMVAYPYTKYLVSVMDVDMAAAVVVASDEAADRLGVPADERVYLRGWCYACDPVPVAEHEPLWASPAMKAAAGEALDRAGVSIDDVAHLDLYSCFTSSVFLALDALGLKPDDPRPFTVTGGLPYAGGPASNYVSHSIAAMVERLRGDPGSYGLVSGVGMHLTKHVYAVYSTTPGPVRPPDDVQADLDRAPRPEIRHPYEGPATVATYSIVHGADGRPAQGVVVCDVGPRARAALSSGSPSARTYATVGDADLLAEIERIEWVGTRVTLENDGERNVIRP